LDALGAEKGAAADEEGVGSLAHKRRKRCIDLAAGVGVEDPDLQSHGAGCRFHVSHRALGDPYIGRFDEQGNASGSGHQLP